MKILFSSILFILSSVVLAQNKRGLAYGFHSSNDIQALTPSVSWWYNWAVAPDADVADNFQNYSYEYIPMAWDKNFDENRLRNFLSNHPETKYLLGYNEPNFLEQANMTPAEAASLWPILEAIADDYNLELVSPAVNFCGDCVPCDDCVDDQGNKVDTYTSPFDYLDDFFELCVGCRVDHVAVHAYVDTIEALDWYINQFKKYNRPIWVTEFAGWENDNDISTPEDQINYLISAVDFLESEDQVFRYAWFIGRYKEDSNPFPYINILADDGELTELGEAYIKMPTHDPETIIDTPALIEAEYYTTMNGIYLEKTEDNTGFADVSFIDQNDWLTYRINVPSTTSYPINFRISSNQAASLNVLVDDVQLFTQEITNNNSLQNFSTFNNTIELTEGEHTIKLEANTSGFRINWFQIGDLSTNNDNVNENNNENFVDNPTEDSNEENSDQNSNDNLNEENINSSNEDLDSIINEVDGFNIYPNPFNNNVTIMVPNTERYTISVYSISGRRIVTTSFLNETIIDMSALSSGIYLARISNDKETFIRKIIKN